MLLFIPQVANQLYKILDTTMIGRIIEDKSELGFYEQSQKVVRLLLTVVTSLGVVMIPRMASTFASGDKKKVNEYMKMSFRFVFFLSFPIMFGLISVSKEFVPVFF
jgi:O-antigen/teichoic acid export membrane protein